MDTVVNYGKKKINNGILREYFGYQNPLFLIKDLFKAS